MEPSSARTDDPFDLSVFDVSGLSDDQLVALASDVAVEQHRRALLSTDPDAVCEQAFADGFAVPGQVAIPFITGGLVVCFGLLMERSKSSHDCTFVSVKHPFEESPRWVWEATDLVHDEVRIVPGAKRVQRSVSLVAATEGLEVDVVTSAARGGAHTMKQAQSYVVRGGELVHVSTRARNPQAGHR